MIVVDKRIKKNILFKDLDIGSLFYGNTRHYMRVMSSQIPYNQCKFNAVDLETGEFEHVDLNQGVIELEGEVWVK